MHDEITLETLEKCFKICHSFWLRKPKLVAQNERKTFGISYSKNMKFFESFDWAISSSINSLIFDIHTYSTVHIKSCNCQPDFPPTISTQQYLNLCISTLVQNRSRPSFYIWPTSKKGLYIYGNFWINIPDFFPLKNISLIFGKKNLLNIFFLVLINNVYKYLIWKCTTCVDLCMTWISTWDDCNVYR